jgi:hypothetical protein
VILRSDNKRQRENGEVAKVIQNCDWFVWLNSKGVSQEVLFTLFNAFHINLIIIDFFIFLLQSLPRFLPIKFSKEIQE